MAVDPFTETRARLARLHAAEARWQAAWEAAQGNDCPYALLAEQHALAEARRAVEETAAADLHRLLTALDAARQREERLLFILVSLLAEFREEDEELGFWSRARLETALVERWRKEAEVEVAQEPPALT